MESKLDLLKSHFLNMYLTALSDFDFAKEEFDLIKDLGKNIGLTDEIMQEILMHPQAVDFVVPEDFTTKIQMLYEYAKIIWADKKILKEEKDLLKKFVAKYGFEKVEEITSLLLNSVQQNLPVEDVINKIEKL